MTFDECRVGLTVRITGRQFRNQFGKVVDMMPARFGEVADLTVLVQFADPAIEPRWFSGTLVEPTSLLEMLAIVSQDEDDVSV